MNKQILRNTIFVGLFLVPFIPFLVSSSFFFPFIATKVFAWRTIVEIIFAAWVILALLDADYRPKKSPILYAILAFLLVLGAANLFGVAPLNSFWSNFERMEGFVSMLHLGAFFLVISSVFREPDWKRWWNTSLVASLLIVFHALFQLMGAATIHQSSARVDASFGNAIYLAVYMLFHIFISLIFMLRQWRDKTLRFAYGALILLQLTVLYYTATRGAILGLLGGLVIMALLNVRNRENRIFRRMSIGLLAALVILIGGFMAVKDSQFVQGSPVLERFASLSLESLKTQGRYFVWPMAYEGFKDRPILGWGQENFTYVFQRYYTPEMVNLEPWFDRAHNVFLDWMVAAGLLGLLAYLSLYAMLLKVLWRDESLPHSEKSILTGLLAAYFFHNFFVFDHLVSYILFFSLLAYIHSRNTGALLFTRPISETSIKRIALPAIGLLLVFAFYLGNVRPFIANTYLIEALKSVQMGAFENSQPYFTKAFQASFLGRSEVVQHMLSNSVPVLTSSLSLEKKNEFYAFAKAAALEDLKAHSNNAKAQLGAGSFFSTVGAFEEAQARLSAARELMPNKQQIYFELGAMYLNMNERAKALEAFKYAHDLYPEYQEAKIIYLVGAIYAGDRTLENQLISELPAKVVSGDSRIISAYKAVGR